ncbi:MAG: PAS domain-containing protein [Opitutaceae bacterium]|nr:PAS domain-containing protein [Opitutaceae bacterium]
MNAPTPASPEAPSAKLTQALADAFLENVPDIVYFKDRESRFIAMSRSCCRKHGFATEADFLGKTDFDLFNGPFAQKCHEEEQQIIRTGETHLGYLEKEIWPDGRVTWSLNNKLPLRDPSGAIIGLFGINRDFTATKAIEDSLETARKELLDATRAAGMAEVANGVIHNVGNVLNSVNVSATLIADGVRATRVASLGKVCALLDQHAADLPALFATPQGRQLPAFLQSLHAHLATEQTRLLAEIDSLRSNIDHIKDIVSMQQSYATVVNIVEPLVAEELVLDALRLNAASLTRHDVQLVRDFQPVPRILAEKPKILQILVNLVRNAKHALDDRGGTDKKLTLRITPGPAGDTVLIIVADNGVGIPPENLVRIFAHGFTTRKKGHGFGLHSSALAAKEMKANLTARSDGPGLGATFTLEMPADSGPAHPPAAPAGETIVFSHRAAG